MATLNQVLSRVTPYHDHRILDLCHQSSLPPAIKPEIAYLSRTSD
jgi:hypothetical protein